MQHHNEEIGVPQKDIPLTLASSSVTPSDVGVAGGQGLRIATEPPEHAPAPEHSDSEEITQRS